MDFLSTFHSKHRTINPVASANGDDLVLTMGGSDQVRLVNWYKVVTEGESNQLVPGGQNGRALTRVEFADGPLWNQTYLEARSGNSQFVGTSGADTLTGTAGADYLAGLGDNDTLNGGAGADAMEGGAGDDTYYIDNAADTVIESFGAGVDTVFSSVTYVMDSNVDKLFLTGNATSGLNGTGNALANLITGNSGANTLIGDGGNDTLIGGNGNNIIDGGTGADSMTGGIDDDRYYVDNAADVVNEGNYATGWDRVFTSVSRTIDANIEQMNALNGSGATLTGNALDNTLSGSNDGLVNTLIGGDGNDTYSINTYDIVIETDTLMSGIDLINVWGDYTLLDFVENLTLGGPLDANGTGNARDNVITGHALKNTLDGGLGSDTLIGGAGDDTYKIARGGGADTVVETVADGDTDVLQFLAGVASNQIWFSHAGSNLEARILGTTDKITMQNWAIGGAAVVEQFKTTDGNKTLSTTQMAFTNLVQAMAGIATGTATSIADVAMTQNQRDALNLALNGVPSWQ